MQTFAALYHSLSQTTSTNEKHTRLVDYLKNVHPADGAWAVALLTGRRAKGTASSRVLRQIAIETSGVPDWLFDECRASVGELSETIALIMPESQPGPSQDEQTLAEVMQQRVLPLAHMDEPSRHELLRDTLLGLTTSHRSVYLKLVRGGLRVGVQRRTVARALAEVACVEPSVMEHRLAGGFDPSPEAFLSLMVEGTEAERRARPYPFYLASSFQGEPDQLGNRSDWLAEWKWDGIRAQVAYRQTGPIIWSRGEEVITDQFPEIVHAAAATLPPETVLDGEVLIWYADRPLPFASLQKRLNRKTPPTNQPSLFDQERAVFLAFDVLEHNGQDIRDNPQAERRSVLESLLADDPAATIRPSRLLTEPDFEALSAARATARTRGAEGLMLKHADSPYLSVRTKPDIGSGWLKWKLDPYTIDAVLVYAYPGTGRRAMLYTDYAFAVWDDDHAELVVFTRAYSGLDQAEIESLDAWIRKNTTRQMGPARAVRPDRVFEIGFEGIARSDRHKAGIAVRFPRILRERTDKQAETADTMGALRALLSSHTSE